MRIEIEIPKEFEKHFNQDKFKDSFERIIADIKRSLKSRDCSCAGRYEYETIEMLEKAFENSKPAYLVDKVVKELKEESEFLKQCNYDYEGEFVPLNDAIEIVKQGSVEKET